MGLTISSGYEHSGGEYVVIMQSIVKCDLPCHMRGHTDDRHNKSWERLLNAVSTTNVAVRSLSSMAHCRGLVVLGMLSPRVNGDRMTLPQAALQHLLQALNILARGLITFGAQKLVSK